MKTLLLIFGSLISLSANAVHFDCTSFKNNSHVVSAGLGQTVIDVTTVDGIHHQYEAEISIVGYDHDAMLYVYTKNSTSGLDYSYLRCYVLND